MTSIEQMFTLEHIKKTIDQNAKSLITAALLTALLLGGYYYVRVYRVEQESAAHATLTEVLEEVTRASSKPEAWQDVALAARSGYRKHSGSSIAPYFLAIEADALIQQGKLDEGQEQLKAVVSSLPKGAPLTSSFALKLARLELHSEDELIRTQGLEALKALAQDQDNLVHDEALYRLANWYLQKNDNEQARATFQRLIDLYKESKDTAGQSAYASIAQEQIDQLTV